MGSKIIKQGIVSASGDGIRGNILLNSATLTGKNGSTVYNNITTGIHNGTSGWNEAYWPCSISAANNPLSGQKITISLDFMCTDISKISAMYYGFGIWNSSGTRVADTNLAVSSYTVLDGSRENNKWCRMYYTYAIPTDWTTSGSAYRLQIKTAAGAEGTTMYHKRIKVEICNYPTPWVISDSDYNFVKQVGLIENQNYDTPFINAKIANDWITVQDFIEI